MQHIFIMRFKKLFFFSGEAGVPFFHASGSEFDEIFVGTGAKRVRQLFGKNTKHFFAFLFKQIWMHFILRILFCFSSFSCTVAVDS